MRKLAWIVWVGAVGIAGGSMLSQPSRAAEERKVDFVKDIQPIFETTCVKCHGADPQGKKPKGKFDMTTKQKAFSTGENKDKNFKKKAEDSLIYQTLLGPVGSGDDEVGRMPYKKDPLPPEQIKLIKDWLDQGANWPDDVKIKLKE
jgi:hypothetical protein